MRVGVALLCELRQTACKACVCVLGAPEDTAQSPSILLQCAVISTGVATMMFSNAQTEHMKQELSCSKNARLDVHVCIPGVFQDSLLT